jgi:hypothetical protein
MDEPINCEFTLNLDALELARLQQEEALELELPFWEE